MSTLNNKLKVTLKAYNNLTPQEQLNLKIKTAAILDNMYTELNDKCKEDKSLMELLTKLAEIKKFTEYDIYSEFTTPNGRFDRFLFLKEKKLAKNYAKLKESILSEIRELENINAGENEVQIAKLKQKLNTIETHVQHFNKALENKKMQEYYLKNKDSYTALEEKANRLIKNYSEKIVENYLNKFPFIIADIMPVNNYFPYEHKEITFDFIKEMLNDKHSEICNQLTIDYYSEKNI